MLLALGSSLWLLLQAANGTPGGGGIVGVGLLAPRIHLRIGLRL